MGKETGFLEYPRKDPGYRPLDERIRDFQAVERRLADADLYEQAARCMDCGIPFCHGCGCTLQNIIPEFNDHVYHRRWDHALKLLLATNPFPEFTGRICPALCEGACVLGINDDPVAIRQIELAIIEKAFADGRMPPRPPRRRLDRRVAVVGSGPAGLATANFLNHAGAQVTVYESARKPGGILRYGIPDFKLEKWVIDRRIDLMRQEGVVFETGTEVGIDVSYQFIATRHDAIVLTGGARQPRTLDAPGSDLQGIVYAMPYLVQQNMLNGGEPVPPDQRITAGGRNVLVIGGGDTGSDCLGTAIRQGASQVYQFEILPEPPPRRAASTPWPAWPLMRRDSSSHKEGGERRWNITTERFEGRDGHVFRAHCAEVEWVGEGGRTVPRIKPESRFAIDVELVLLAMGFVGPGPNRLVEGLGLERDARGFIKRDASHMTSRRGIFVAGDMTRGASLVLRAIEDGIAVARHVLGYLTSAPR